MEQPINTRRHISPWLFFGLTYGLSWLLWVPAALSGQDVTGSPWFIAYALGAAVPSIIGVTLTYVSESRETRRDFWRRTFDFRRIKPAAYAFILLAFPLVYGVAALADRLTGGSGAGFDALQQASLPTLLGLPIMMLLNSLIEELGWRGFALDRLQRRWGALGASLALGLLHALWHTPLYLARGTIQYEWGLFSQNYWMFLLNATLGSVMHTWLYNDNRRSILTAILFHGAHNVTLALFAPISDWVLVYAVVVNLVIVVGLVRACGAKALTCQAACLLLLLLAGACTPRPTDDFRGSGSGDGLIAFVSTRDGNGEIYVMNADGSDQRRLTNYREWDGFPSWSPDGQRIAFYSYVNTRNWVIKVMDADGGNVRQLTDNGVCDGAPTWSPDGTRIAFGSDADCTAEHREVYVINADGGDQRNLTNHDADDVHAVWSPDGTQIAFSSNRSFSAPSGTAGTMTCTS